MTSVRDALLRDIDSLEAALQRGRRTAPKHAAECLVEALAFLEGDDDDPYDGPALEARELRKRALRLTTCLAFRIARDLHEGDRG